MQDKIYISEEYININYPITSPEILTGVAILNGVVFTSISLAQYLLSNLIVIGERKHLPILSQKLKTITSDDKVEVYLIKEKSPNAFNAGTKSLYITSGAFKIWNNDEIISILLHEYGHRKKLHIQKDLIFKAIKRASIFTIIFANLLTLPFFYFGVHTSRYIDFLYTRIIGRRHEYQADLFSVKYGYGESLISAFKKIDNLIKVKVCKNLGKNECDARLRDLHSDDEHPLFIDRIQRLLSANVMKIVKNFSMGGLKMAINFLGKLSTFAKNYPNLLLTTLQKVI